MFALVEVGDGGSVDKKSKLLGQSFELLPIEERAQQYREMADATFLKAQKVEDPQLRAQYFNMATSWHALAQELEAGNSDPELAPSGQKEVPQRPDTN
jgi:ABC-type phosphate transport system auxiliary subunit